MRVQDFTDMLGAEFYTGVPDSQLRPLCDYLMDSYGVDGKHHIIGANEGNCVAIAAGYHLATGKIPVVYMQNSGLGNAINPMASLIHSRVYGIPMLFVIGWRGEPGVHDEPQHIVQGEITLPLLEEAGIQSFVLGQESGEAEISAVYADWLAHGCQEGKSLAFVVKKGGLSYENKPSYQNQYLLRREEAIRHILAVSGTDPIVSTTGKASRELYELRVASEKAETQAEPQAESVGQGGEKNNEPQGRTHGLDFLTVGSMGHSSSIALGIALHENAGKGKIWCIDGDGAALMHLGAMALIGSLQPEKLVHVLINNVSHESVGGLPTVAGQIDFPLLAKACGYRRTASVESPDALDKALREMKEARELCFLEVKCQIGAREDLGRPAESPAESKRAFMEGIAAQFL